MIHFTRQQLKQQRKQRERLKIGDRVAIIGPLDRVLVATVKKIMPERVTVALTKDSNFDYRIADGGELSDFPVTKLRGLAMQEELELLKKPVLPTKSQKSQTSPDSQFGQSLGRNAEISNKGDAAAVNRLTAAVLPN